jgi:hypothetical protein
LGTPRAVREPRIGLERRGGQDDPDEEIRAEPWVEEHRVLPNPAQTGAGRQVTLEDRSRVDVDAADGAGSHGLEVGEDGPKPRL